MHSTVNRAKLGTTEYHAQWLFDDHDEPATKYGPFDYFADLATAQIWASCKWPVDDSEIVTDEGQWWIRIDRGTWIADDIEDDEYGTILDATFERDESFYCVGYIDEAKRTILWDVEQ